jgi:glycosyltransferase involved in cell wall biosynthesis
MYVLQTGDRNRHLNALLDHMPSEAVRFEVVVLGQPGQLAADLKERGVIYRSLGIRHLRNLALVVMRVRSLIKEIQPDLIHCHLFIPTLAIELARLTLIRPPPSVHSRHHNLGHHLAKRPIHRWLDAWMAGRAGMVIAVSKAVKETLVHLDGVEEQRVEVVYNGIDERVLAQNPTDVDGWREAFGPGPRAVAAGRIHAEKDYPTLIRAIGRAGLRFPELTLTVAGTGSSTAEDSIRRLVAELGLSHKVRFLGWVENVLPLMAAADIFVQASRDEAFSQTIMEALCLGVPVAVTTPGGALEVVTPWYQPLPPGDPDALADRISAVLEDSESARRHAARAADGTKERFSADKLAAGHLRVYRRALASSKAARR